MFLGDQSSITERSEHLELLNGPPLSLSLRRLPTPPRSTCTSIQTPSFPLRLLNVRSHVRRLRYQYWVMERSDRTSGASQRSSFLSSLPPFTDATRAPAPPSSHTFVNPPFAERAIACMQAVRWGGNPRSASGILPTLSFNPKTTACTAPSRRL